MDAHLGSAAHATLESGQHCFLGPQMGKRLLRISTKCF